jgi:hypothetical protein
MRRDQRSAPQGNEVKPAALALVAWYLILPYRLPNSTKHDVSASLSHWCKVANFLDRDHCESSRVGRCGDAGAEPAGLLVIDTEQ